MKVIAARGGAEVALESDGLVLPKVGRLPWSDVLGSVRLGQGRRERLYVLLRRESPRLPWVVLNARALRGSTFSRLEDLAGAIDSRLTQAGYRQGARPLARQSASELLEDVLAGRHIAGAVDIRCARGPRRTLTLITEGMAGAAAGAIAGAMLGVFAGALLRVIPNMPDWIGSVGMGVGAVLGSVLTLGSTRLFRQLRIRRSRVLVLTPEGCVVGLPEGPQAFLWRDIGAFEITPVRASEREANEALRLVDPQGAVVADIDRAWFGAPLELVVAVANAYRARIV